MASNKKSKQAQAQRRTGSLEPAAGSASGSEKKKSRRSGGKRSQAAKSAEGADASPRARQPAPPPEDHQEKLPVPEPKPAPQPEAPPAVEPIAAEMAAPERPSEPSRDDAAEPVSPPPAEELPAAEAAEDVAPTTARPGEEPEPAKSELAPAPAESRREARPAPVDVEPSPPPPPVVVEESPPPASSGFDRLPLSVAGFQAAWESAPTTASRLQVVVRVTDSLLRLVVALELGALGACEAKSRLETGVAVASRGRPGASLTTWEWAGLAFSLARLAAGKTDGVVGRLASSLAGQAELARTLETELHDLARFGSGVRPGLREQRMIELLGQLSSACEPLRSARIVAVSAVVVCEGDDSIEYELRDVGAGSDRTTMWSKRPLLRPWCYLLEDNALRQLSLFPMAYAAPCATCDSTRIHLATRIAFGPAGALVPGTCVRCGNASEARLPRSTAHPIERMTVIW